MPNTLAHIGIGGAATRLAVTNADLKWIYLGCIIPDMPWIFQRLGNVFIPGINLYDLRLYVIIQSTLFFSIILSLALASFSKEYFRTLLILAFGSLIHLFLDSLQRKWANGVLILAPFNWDLMNFNLFWPESMWIYLITIFSLVYVVATFKNSISTPLNIEIKNSSWFLFFIAGSIYFLLPLFIVDQPFQANNHYVKTLKEVESRAGKYFEIDRRPYRYENGVGVLNTFADEDIKLRNIDLNTRETLSIKAKFIDKNTAKVIDYHIHSTLFRDGSSYAGLIIVASFWLISFFKNRRKI